MAGRASGKTFESEPMRRSVLVLAVLAAAVPASAGTLDTPDCRRDLFQTRGAITTSRDRIVAAVGAERPDRCRIQRRHVEVMKRAGDVYARCLTEPDRGRATAEARESVREFETEIARSCKGL